MMPFTVRQARNYKGITQDDMAAALGVSPQTYRRYENKPFAMPFGVLDRFSRLTNIPVENIVISTEEETPSECID